MTTTSGLAACAGREEEVLAAANARASREAQARARYADGALAFGLLGLRAIVEAR